jgi:ATP-dependent Lhr-like helicase
MTAPQIAAVPRVLDGENILLIAPTATGKTEAIVAPIAELLKASGDKNQLVIYLVPTKALVNDIYARLSGPLTELGLEVARKHGDRPGLPSKAVLNFLITTPESMDSLLCRARKLVSNVRHVVVDEVHLIDKTYRGDHVRVLLQRLRECTRHSILSCHLLSATVADPAELAERYLDSPVIVTVAGPREIESTLVPDLEGAIKLAQDRKWKKLLIFANSRRAVESLAAALKKILGPNRVVAHHGSLSKEARENAETFMKEARFAVCVATSTLEIGIDIGSIDAVVLAEPPFSISALLQRVGRSNRRSTKINAVAITAGGELESTWTVLFNIARQGTLEDDPYEVDRSVGFQQVLSLVYECPQGVLRERIAALVAVLIGPEQMEKTLRILKKRAFIEIRKDTIWGTEKLRNLGDLGAVHSNVPNSMDYQVVDARTGKELGKISESFDSEFILSGRAWRVDNFKGGVIKVVPTPGIDHRPAAFRSRAGMGAFAYLVDDDKD